MCTPLSSDWAVPVHAASITEAERSFVETFAGAGVALDGELVRVAAEGTGGYPFLIQLIGYYLWQEAERAPAGLDAAAVGRAVTAGRRRNELIVIEAALSTTSGRDRDFLHAMA